MTHKFRRTARMALMIFIVSLLASCGNVQLPWENPRLDGAAQPTAVPRPSPSPSPTPPPSAAASTAPASAAPASAAPASAAPASARSSAAPSAAASSTGNGGTTTDFIALHWKRLAEFDPIFRQSNNTDWQGWLKAAGVTWDTMSKDARQVEEETSPEGNVYISGVQVDGCGVKINWPNIVTTDVPGRITSKAGNSFEYQPDKRPNGNKSVLYTNVVACGPVTIWISGYSWGQFTSRLGAAGTTPVTSTTQPSAAPASIAPSAAPSANPACMTVKQLQDKYGIDVNSQGSVNGLLIEGNNIHGATLRLTAAQADELKLLGWTIQGSNPSVKSAWSPNDCRPLQLGGYPDPR